MATEYLTNDTDLKAVADAIRTKSGSTAQLSFPDGFVSAVNGIQTGGGGGGGTGFKVTFPATAKDWNNANLCMVLLADGTYVNGTEYSFISGKTFDSVVGLKIYNNSTWMAKITLSAGAIAQVKTSANSTDDTYYKITNAPGTTPTFFAGGASTFWWPLTDTVISAIEMYNTD